MSKKKDISTDITKIGVDNLPSFMQDEKVTGLESLKEFIVPPRIKVIQKAAGEELLSTFSAGDVILSPLNAVITEMERDNKGRPVEGSKTSFQFVPIFFYPEWATVNPIQMKGQLPFLRYRTTDPADPVVTKAKNPGLRSEPCPEDPEYKIRHVEYLNFIVALYNHPLGIEPVIMNFSKGEWSSGSKFASLLKMRRAPMYGCVFEAVVGLRHGQLGDWYGFNITNPDEGSPWVDEDNYEVFKKLHIQFAEYHKESRLRSQIEPDEDTPDEAAVTSSSEF